MHLPTTDFLFEVAAFLVIGIILAEVVGVAGIWAIAMIVRVYKDPETWMPASVRKAQKNIE